MIITETYMMTDEGLLLSKIFPSVSMGLKSACVIKYIFKAKKIIISISRDKKNGVRNLKKKTWEGQKTYNVQDRLIIYGLRRQISPGCRYELQNKVCILTF